jgi:hypothetical protein
MGKVTQLRGNAYSWFVSGTAEMCQIFLFVNKNCHIEQQYYLDWEIFCHLGYSTFGGSL